MFNLQELTILGKALILMQKSLARLAAKDEQPESVANEFRKVQTEVATVGKKVADEMFKIQSAPVKK